MKKRSVVSLRNKDENVVSTDEKIKVGRFTRILWVPQDCERFPTHGWVKINGTFREVVRENDGWEFGKRRGYRVG